MLVPPRPDVLHERKTAIRSLSRRRPAGARAGRGRRPPGIRLLATRGSSTSSAACASPPPRCVRSPTTRWGRRSGCGLGTPASTSRGRSGPLVRFRSSISTGSRVLAAPTRVTSPGDTEREIERRVRGFSRGSAITCLVIVETDKLTTIRCLPRWARARRFRELLVRGSAAARPQSQCDRVHRRRLRRLGQERGHDRALAAARRRRSGAGLRPQRVPLRLDLQGGETRRPNLTSLEVQSKWDALRAKPCA